MKLETFETTQSFSSKSENGIKEKKKAKKDKVEEPSLETTKKIKKVKKENEEVLPATPNSNGWSPSNKEEEDGDFRNFRISSNAVQKLQSKNINYLFPIQAQTFNYVYDGEDLLGQARTGTGKTLSFALPIVEKIQSNLPVQKKGRPPMVIVMAPTRELAKQVSEDFHMVSSKLSIYCIYGGMDYYPQEKALRDGLDVLVGTPGRIMDHLNKGTLDLSQLKHVILDEVDQMLDMGFADSVEEILKVAYNRAGGIANPQTLLFSATVPPWVRSTSKKYMRADSKHVDLIGKQSCRTATTVQHLAIKCGYQDRAGAVGRVVQCYSGDHGRAMVFCQTKRDADELAVSPDIKQACHVLHGDVPQAKREIVLKKFREGSIRCLVTTDVAARGLDVPEVDLVVQCSPPRDVDSYIHRSGRTGRAGRTGTCVLFFKPMEEHELRNVERIAGITFKRVGPPTVQDIINNAADDAERSLENVSEAILCRFREKATQLIDKKGAVEALASALAVLSGTTEMKERSLLTSAEGYATYVFRTNIEIRGPGYVWKAVEKCLGSRKEEIKGMRMCKDKMGCVFDVPTALESLIKDNWEDGQFDTLQKATELPELAEYAGTGASFGSDRHGGGGGGGGRGFAGQRRGGFNGNSANRFNANGYPKKRAFDDVQENSGNKRIKFD